MNAQLPSVVSVTRRRLLAALLTLPVLSACSLPLPGSGPPPRLFTLSPKSTFHDAMPTIDRQLLVEEPVAAAGLNTARIIVKPTPYEIQYFASVAWAERAPDMIQTLLIESFENSNRIRSVGREVASLRGDFMLKSELREFQAEEFGAGDSSRPNVRVRMSGTVVRMPERQIVDRFEYEQVVTATGSHFEDVIAAFDAALDKVMGELVKQTLRIIHDA